MSREVPNGAESMTERRDKHVWNIRDGSLSLDDHTLIMGIVNATPDSFSDGGRYDIAEVAVAHGLSLWEQGADIVDVGGESTRPGATPVGVAQELARVVPVVRALAADGVVVSVDTMKSEVAAAAIEAGARIVNDVSAFRDPVMAELCASTKVGVVLMHMLGTPQTMQDDPSYGDVVAEVAVFLVEMASRAVVNGVEASRICIDPGIGFGKTFDHNLDLLNGTERLAQLGYPLLVGTSRKGFLGDILQDAGITTTAEERDAATAATVAIAIAGGASVVRVHNVSHVQQAARTADAIVRASQRRK